MAADTYSATWVSHSSMGDFIKCPRAYYLKNVYKDPSTRHKMTVMTPPLALGQAVHEVLESLSVKTTEERFRTSLLESFQEVWKKLTGKRGGFYTDEQEQTYKLRGEEMLRRVMNNPGLLKEKAVKLKMELPHYWLSTADEIILCGKIDWLQYHPEDDSVTILDFKTGKNEENAESLQLPIYQLLVANTQKRAVRGVSYWYIDKDDQPTPQTVVDLETAHQRVLEVAKKVKLARKLELYKCPQGESGCFACRPFEAVLRGEAEKVGVNEYNVDVYVLPPRAKDAPVEDDSVIL